MKTFLLIFSALCLSALVLPASAQVYRCGNEYSHQPCKGAKEVDVSPPVVDLDGPKHVTLYLCKSGASYYWIRERCATRGWLLERTELVSSSASFDDQVAEAKAKQAAARVQLAGTTFQTRPSVSIQSRQSTRALCEQLDQRVNELDSMGRIGSPRYNLDWIRDERRKARDEQFRLRC